MTDDSHGSPPEQAGRRRPSPHRQQPQDPQPAYEQPPSYGQQPAYDQPPYGQPPYGQLPYGQPPYGQPPYGQSAHGQSPYGYPGPAPSRVSLPATGWVLLGAAVLVLIGSVSPWATVRLFGNISVNGTDGDGVLTLIFALVFGAMGLVIGVKQGRLWTSIVGLVFAGLTVLTSAYDAANISGVVSRDVGSQYVSVGFGLWLVLVGGLAAMGVAIAAMAKRAPRT